MTRQQVDQAADGAVGAERVLRVLADLAAEPDGLSLGQLATRLRAPKPTVHRALNALCRQGFARRLGRGQYSLGEEFLRLAFSYQERRSDVAEIEPILRRLSRAFGETAHFAVLDDVDVVYRAKVDPPQGAIRLTSVVGGRNPAYRTGVGKALLAQCMGSYDQLQRWLAGQRLERRTPNTITTPVELWRDLTATRERGFAIDDQENEVGVNCVALPVFLGSPSMPAGAVSVSGLAFRTPLPALLEAVPRISEMLGPYVDPRLSEAEPDPAHTTGPPMEGR